MSRADLEILAVLGTGILKFFLVDYLHAKFWFILIAGLFWCSYIIFRIKTDKSIMVLWGFKTSGFRESVRVISIPALVVTGLSFTYGLMKGHLVFNWHIIPVVILYPLWGTVQQFLVISLFGGNLSDKRHPRFNTALVVLLTAALFGIVHYPSFLLITATFFLAIFYFLLFIRFRNLWALGIFHGWLACIFYFFVLGRDPWLEFVNTI